MRTATSLFFAVAMLSVASTASAQVEREAFYRVTGRDRCPSPRDLGAWVVERVNQPLTRCADGAYRKGCRVTGFDFTAIGAGETERAALESSAATGQAMFKGVIRNGLLVVTEAWLSSTGTSPTGTFYRVEDSGVRCIAFPCPSYRAAALNSTAVDQLAVVDLAPTGAPEEILDVAINDLFTNGLLVAGTYQTVTGPAGTALALTATAFYQRFVPAGI